MWHVETTEKLIFFLWLLAFWSGVSRKTFGKEIWFWICLLRENPIVHMSLWQLFLWVQARERQHAIPSHMHFGKEPTATRANKNPDWLQTKGTLPGKGKRRYQIRIFCSVEWFPRNIAAKAESLLGTLIRMVARENSRYFATPWLVSPPNHISGTNTRNSILMTCHYSDLGSASDWSFCEGNLLQPIRSTTQVWVMTRHQYGISAGVPRTLFLGDLVASRNVGCFLRLSKWTPWATSLRPSKSRQKFEGKGVHS